MVTRHHLLVGLGWLFFAVGCVGLVVPLLPTTVFWILAGACWVRSSPRLAEWLYAHPRVGAPVQAFLERGEISRAGKLAAAIGMAIGFTVWLVLIRPGWMAALIVGIVLLAVAGWVASRREPAPQTPP